MPPLSRIEFSSPTRCNLQFHIPRHDFYRQNHNHYSSVEALTLQFIDANSINFYIDYLLVILVNTTNT